MGLWQVIARVIDQGSRLSAVRLAGYHAACDILGLSKFNEDNLYDNLDWLSENQSKIEQRLFSGMSLTQTSGLFLYDVTSSYLEGTQNELSDRESVKRLLDAANVRLPKTLPYKGIKVTTKKKLTSRRKT